MGDDIKKGHGPQVVRDWLEAVSEAMALDEDGAGICQARRDLCTPDAPCIARCAAHRFPALGRRYESCWALPNPSRHPLIASTLRARGCVKWVPIR